MPVVARQKTLGTFFTMPPGAKAPPPQQSNLHEMWRKRSSKPKDASTGENAAQDVDLAGRTEGKPRRRKQRTTSSPVGASSPPVSQDDDRTEPGPSTTGGRAKRRRIIDSDDEGEPLPSAMPTDEPIEEEEEFLISDTEEGSAAITNAQLAMSKTVDVDVDGGWKVGESIPYAALTHVFGMIEATSKRLEITALLTSFLLLVIKRSKEGDTDSLRQAVYLCINRLCPDYKGLELGIGESLLQKAIAESTGRKLEAIKADLKEVGDLGLVAINSKNSQRTLFKPKPLTVSFVFTQLTEIAMTSGNASQNKKIQIVTKLLAACKATSQEAKYIIRSLEGKLRIGLAERTLIVSLAHAIVLSENEKGGNKWNKETLAQKLEEGANIVKSVYSELPSYDHVIPALLRGGIQGLRADCKLSPGIPLKPMLAKPTKAIGEVLDRFEGKRFTCEYKYDGERAQVHKTEGGELSVFSRNSEDMSAKYPDIFEQLPKAIKDGTTTFVLDCEAVAIDRTTMRLLPFQELSRRKRKDVKVEDIKVWVCLFAFDLLYLNGEPLLHRSLVDRRELLRKHFAEVTGGVHVAKASDGETTDEIQAFLEESVKDGCEGLMVKMLDTDASFYEPSRRSINWLKLKKDYLNGVGDSFDLVVVGGYHGKGKRTAVYGAFLLACYDPDKEILKTHAETLKDLEVAKCRADVDTGGAKPDVWFEPKIVWEVLAADLSLSPIYSAAKGLVEARGISLRFPRFIRMRDDKNADDATGPEQIAEMYQRQSLANKGGKKSKIEDDFW
ncbi:hypothetical protein BS47DRAFT_1377634 [Hydnum rufescens UP504]|uniref:DNA ligase n=1 Tax=Hydnum rufescens UP504 TaxID=1448309 RepID=A0A9P6ANQ8_9AGAM|nr:hypothetical protein BS47DRAFT_1377634 [Hydnum rufescens UP504]